MTEDRNLTDADVAAIVHGLKTEMMKDFQLEIGRGVLRWFKMAFIGLLIIMAVYGFAHENGYALGSVARP